MLRARIFTRVTINGFMLGSKIGCEIQCPFDARSSAMEPSYTQPSHRLHAFWICISALFEQAGESSADAQWVEKEFCLWETGVFVQEAGRQFAKVQSQVISV